MASAAKWGTPAIRVILAKLAGSLAGRRDLGRTATKKKKVWQASGRGRGPDRTPRELPQGKEPRNRTPPSNRQPEMESRPVCGVRAVWTVPRSCFRHLRPPPRTGSPVWMKERRRGSPAGAARSQLQKANPAGNCPDSCSRIFLGWYSLDDSGGRMRLKIHRDTRKILNGR